MTSKKLMELFDFGTDWQSVSGHAKAGQTIPKEISSYKDNQIQRFQKLLKTQQGDIAEIFWLFVMPEYVKQVMEQEMSGDLNVFKRGAVDGCWDSNFEDFHVMVYPSDISEDEKFEYAQGYRWGTKHPEFKDNPTLPPEIVAEVIQLQIKQFEDQIGMIMFKDMVFGFLKKITVDLATNLKKLVWDQTGEAYIKGGALNATKHLLFKGIPAALWVSVCEVLDNGVLPPLFVSVGLPPISLVVGIGDLSYPILIDKLLGEEKEEFNHSEEWKEYRKANPTIRNIDESALRFHIRKILIKESFGFRRYKKQLEWEDIEQKYPKFYQDAKAVLDGAPWNGPFDGLSFSEFIASIDPDYLQTAPFNKQTQLEIGLLLLDNASHWMRYFGDKAIAIKKEYNI